MSECLPGYLLGQVLGTTDAAKAESSGGPQKWKAGANGRDGCGGRLSCLCVVSQASGEHCCVV